MSLTKTSELIIALEKERKQFKDNGHNTKGHDEAISYLTLGYPINMDNELIEAIIDDFETMYSDYCK